MTTTDTRVTPAFARLLPLLPVMFAASGAAGLIYEIVWLQLLQLVIGSSAVSLAVLLGTYMGGMCLGSLLLPRIEKGARHPLLVYAALEFGTAVFGLLVLWIVPLIESFYTAGVAHGLPNMILRGVACAVCLLPPTLLMGATLPAISRWVSTGVTSGANQGAAWWGYLYGANIAGGVIGCFAGGFYLLRLHDMAFASYVAAGMNVAIGLVAIAMARGVPFRKVSDVKLTGTPAAVPVAIYVSIGISGLCALGAEVVWTRILSLMLGPTVYTFSIILGVFLAGLGLGSAAGSRLVALKKNPRAWLGLCQFALCVAVACAAYMLADWLPYWTGNLNSTAGIWHDFAGDILRTALAVLPAALLWGASFPLALASVASDGIDPARVVGGIYGANTVGAIAGSILFSLWFIPAFGTHGSQIFLIVFSAIGAVVVLAESTSKMKLAGGMAMAALLAWSVPAIPWMLVGFGRRLPSTVGRWDLLRMAEGRNSSAAWSQYDGSVVYFHVSGKVEATTEPQDMSLQRMLGHLPALLHPRAESVLIVGFGAGVTAGTFVVHPEIKHIDICEIEPVIPPLSSQFFNRENHDVFHDPRTRIADDDARHFVLTSPDKYDIITSDPIHPFVKGMASLYTTEYFEMCKRHLNPGGFVTQWVPLYESNLEAVRSEIATFFEAFPNGTIWGNVNTDGEGYDLVLMGQQEKLNVDVDALDARLNGRAYQGVRESLHGAGFSGASDLLATYAAQASDLREWMRGAEINHDRNLRLQYLAGFGLNTNAAGMIYDQMLGPARFPSDIFTGSAAALDRQRSSFHHRRF